MSLQGAIGTGPGRVCPAGSDTASVCVYILLATYNGARFLAEQVASIQAQTHANWRLLIRDDRSTDATPRILHRLAQGDSRIRILSAADPLPLGVRGNFSALMESALGECPDYACFCDQDDRWHPDKLARGLELMGRIESREGADVPALVHSDLAVVDEDLKPIADSFFRFQGYWQFGRSPTLATLLTQNSVVGCTVMMNRALLDLATPVPETAYLHDWWVALCAAACGTLACLPAPTVDYRQHRGNLVGVGGVRRLLDPMAWGRTRAKLDRIMVHSLAQARELALRCGAPGLRRPEYGPLVAEWASLPSLPFLSRVRILLARRPRSASLPLTLVVYAQVALLDRLLAKVDGDLVRALRQAPAVSITAERDQ